MIKIVDGNILQATEDIIGHQVNCQGVMGAGLAKQIRNKYPKCYKEYRDFVYEFNHHGSHIFLGEVYYYEDESGKIIANLFGQDGYGTLQKQTVDEALRRCFEHVHEAVTEVGSKYYGKSVALPYGIGCGLAGGDWNIVSKMIEEVFDEYEVTLYKFK